MKRYKFKSLAMLGAIYLDEEEALIENGTEFVSFTDHQDALRELAKEVLPFIEAEIADFNGISQHYLDMRNKLKALAETP